MSNEEETYDVHLSIRLGSGVQIHTDNEVRTQAELDEFQSAVHTFPQADYFVAKVNGDLRSFNPSRIEYVTVISRKVVA